MTTEDTVPVPIEKSIISISIGEYFTQTSADGAPMVKYTLEVATQEAVTIPTSKTLVVTSEMRELMVQLAPVLLGGTNAPSSPYENTTSTIVETGSGSSLPVLTPITNIMKELTLQIVGQFFVIMKYCVKLILYG